MDNDTINLAWELATSDPDTVAIMNELLKNAGADPASESTQVVAKYIFALGIKTITKKEG